MATSSRYDAAIDTLGELRDQFRELRQAHRESFRAYLIAADCPPPDTHEYLRVLDSMHPPESAIDIYRRGDTPEELWRLNGFMTAVTQPSRRKPAALARIYDISLMGKVSRSGGERLVAAYSQLAAQCWQTLPAFMRELDVPHYVYPQKFSTPVACWTSYMFAVAWTSSTPCGLTARRVSVANCTTFEYEEMTRWLQDHCGDTPRGHPRIAKSVSHLRKQMANDPFWQVHISHVNHPIHQCRAYLNPPLFDAAVLTLNEVIRRLRAEPSGASGRIALPNAKSAAWSQYTAAIDAQPDLETCRDAEVYQYVRENLLDENEHIPSEQSWCKYVSDARRALGRQKWRKGLTKTSKSMVKQSGQAVDEDGEDGSEVD